MKVLIVEEDKFVRSIYESELHQQNILVVFASNGDDGLVKAKEEKPNLILMELILTKKNGFDLLNEIKKEPSTRNIPVVVCSALSQESDIKEAMSLGALKYYPKDTYSLKQVIKEILEILLSQ